MFRFRPIPTPELVTAPTAEPVSLDELKRHVRQDIEEDDQLICGFGIAARQWFEVALDRQLVTATWRVKLPYFHAWTIELPYPPLQSSGFSIAYKDMALATQTLSASSYDVVTTRTPGVVQPKFGSVWPVTAIHPEAVTITFQAGYGAVWAVSELIKAGIKILVGHWYVNREAVSAGTLTNVPLAVDSIAAAARAHRF